MRAVGDIIKLNDVEIYHQLKSSEKRVKKTDFHRLSDQSDFDDDGEINHLLEIPSALGKDFNDLESPNFASPQLKSLTVVSATVTRERSSVKRNSIKFTDLMNASAKMIVLKMPMKAPPRFQQMKNKNRKSFYSKVAIGIVYSFPKRKIKFEEVK